MGNDVKTKNKNGDMRGMGTSQKNLIPFSQRSKQECSELGREGQVKSVVKRRENKTLRTAAEVILNMPVTNQLEINKIKAAGFDIPDDLRLMDEILINLALRARNGNTAAFKALSSLFVDSTHGVSVEVQNGEEQKSRVTIYLPQIDSDSE